MVRKIMHLALVFTLLLLPGFWHATNAYSYLASDEETDYMPTFGKPTYISSVKPEAVVVPAEVKPPIVHYQVNAGDTLYKISRDFGVTVNALIVANDIEDPRLLMIGQRLDIPVDEPGIDLPDGKHEVIRKVLKSTLTAYTAGVESTGKTPSNPMYGITYSGIKAEEGRTIAVDPSVIPLGSTVFIDGIGIRKAEDTGSAIRGSRIDVFMDDLGQAVEFGVKKNVKVYVLSMKENV